MTVIYGVVNVINTMFVTTFVSTILQILNS